MTRPAVAQSLETMVGEYSGWHWLHDDPSRQFTPPAIERLGEIAAPTLVAVGALDIEDFHQIAATLEAGIPDVWKVVVPDVGHILNMEAPERCNEMVTAFLAETERRSRR
jgi:pimeloyl-ACP methyl ester carboxylesterase